MAMTIEEAWRQRAEKAEARVAELESALEEQVESDFRRIWKLKDRVMDLEERLYHTRRYWADKDAWLRWAGKMTPPDGHVAVMLPRETVKWVARSFASIDDKKVIRDACRKALEEDNG